MPADLDSQLREYAARWRSAQAPPPPVHVDDVDIAHPPIPRRPRTVGLAAAAVILVVALTTAGVAVFRHASHEDRSASSVVPWDSADQVPTTTALRVPAQVSTSINTRPCRVDDFTLLAATTELDGNNPGWLATHYTLRAVGPSACTVGYGDVPTALVAADGTALPNDQGVRAGGGATASERPLVTPGQLVSDTVDWYWTDAAGARPDRILLAPGSTTYHLDPATSLSVPVAGVDIPVHVPDTGSAYPGALFRSGWETSQPVVADASVLAVLTARVTAPAGGVAGAPFRYTVTLTNGSAAAVPLAPCPTVVQVLRIVPDKMPVSAGTRGPLNCSGVRGRMIPAHTSVVFRFEVPTTALPTGAGDIDWQLADASGRPVVNAPGAGVRLTR